MKSYIVRIYRWGKNKHRDLVGIVEEAEAKEKKAFTNIDELWDILRSEKKAKKKIQELKNHKEH